MTAPLDNLLQTILPDNRFYARKLEALPSLDALFTTKQELLDDQKANPIYGTDLTFPLHQYTRFCQTSGTSGHPLAGSIPPKAGTGC
jgi:phenylacetate-coenzyme A ligase PaaK-like adenylate-forming protein